MKRPVLPDSFSDWISPRKLKGIIGVAGLDSNQRSAYSSRRFYRPFPLATWIPLRKFEQFKYDILFSMPKHPIYSQCVRCQKDITILNYSKTGFSRQKKFCSDKCASQYKYHSDLINHKPNVSCKYCSKLIYKKPRLIKQSKTGLFFCTVEHKNKFYSSEENKEFLPKHYFKSKNKIKKNKTKKKNTNRATFYRQLVFEIHKVPKICNRCGYCQNDAAIIIHHKDRNRKNNTIENLEVLCCNCHLIEHNNE